MSEILLITISGEDHPGVTAGVTAILAQHRVNILDIGQAVIHATLSMGILIELPAGVDREAVTAAVDAQAEAQGMRVKVSPVASVAYDEWIQAQGRARYIITLLARKITADQLARVTEVVSRHNLNIDSINRLSGRIPLGELPALSKACVEFSVRGPLADSSAFRRDLLEVAGALDVDLAFQEDNMFRRNRRLVAFDMDSTLIEAEVIDELAVHAGVGDQVSEITERAMRGELDFSESFRARVALLEGLGEEALERIAGELRITEGAEHLISTLRKLGYKTAILSGGFTYFARYLQQRLGIDYVHANELDIENGQVTGKVTGTIVDGERKAFLLRQLAEQEGLDLQQVIAVGDGANDLPMLSAAGLGIAFRAKPLVKQSAEQSISTLGLDAILYLLGFSDRYQSDH
ncbi:phosphoserine phosphatase SerB [Halioglobus japonicus]|uniref:phosphoserine phosphatase SerB n=1 Tax=Halioglobus TaxID=1217416 RepID=UPI0007C21A5C|nr:MULTISPECIES: phosphoserine phosphatase SerB [Halioglobus]AQA17484.1 phosphoserine phosphatase SerB [Halioglobus japonicus]KZX56066.1 phosphoserine phosphatase [Halioglobus sp. HI00S01]GHD15517.1 phosphoserine phosphatase SerB [Halioglobus japonicus]